MFGLSLAKTHRLSKLSVSIWPTATRFWLKVIVLRVVIIRWHLIVLLVIVKEPTFWVLFTAPGTGSILSGHCKTYSATLIWRLAFEMHFIKVVGKFNVDYWIVYRLSLLASSWL